MCKIAIITGIRHRNPKIEMSHFQTFIEEVGANMVGWSNKDGLGYAAVTSDGKLFGERWLDPEDAFDYRVDASRATGMLDFIKPKFTPKEWNTFGTVSKNFSAIIMHTRYATTSKGMKNVHPFVDDATSTALIHNGVVDYEVSDNIRSTCDSERILNKYLEHGVINNPDNIKKALNEINGYFACGVITKVDGRMVVDVFKDGTARLGAVYVPALDITVFTTDPEDVVKVCKHYKLGYENYEVKDSSLLRLDAITGEAITRVDFTYQRKYNSYHNTQEYMEKYQKSLGVENDKVKDFRNLKATDFKNEVSKLDKTIDQIIDKNKDDHMNIAEATKNGWKVSADHKTWSKVGK